MEKKDEALFNELFEKSSGLAEYFYDSGITEEDLHQERALVILEYISGGKHEGKDCEHILAELESLYSERINELISQDKASSDVSEKILKRVNKVNDAAIKYKEEYYIKPTPEELADYLGVTVNYILDTIQMSGYEITEIDFDKPPEI